MSTFTPLEFEARNVQFLEFELNNQCQLARCHEWCPRNVLGCQPLVVLDEHAIAHVTEFFRQYDFSGTVYFSIYSEPLLDERLPYLISYVRRMLPKCLVQMYTNGIALTETTAEKLAKAGLGMLRLSVYKETSGLMLNGALEILRKAGVYIAPIDRFAPVSYSGNGWDERLGIYDRDLGCKAPCYMPIQYFCVNCHGDLMLCWDDWRSTTTYGNVVTQPVEDVLMNPARLEKIAALKRGEREGVCKGCARPTELCISEYRGRLKL